MPVVLVVAEDKRQTTEFFADNYSNRFATPETNELGAYRSKGRGLLQARVDKIIQAARAAGARVVPEPEPEPTATATDPRARPLKTLEPDQ